MSLNFDLTRIKDYETVCWKINEQGERYMDPVTNALIWYTMTLDLGEILPRNVDEWYIRMWINDKLFGPLASTGKPITLDELMTHQGLRTNVVTRTRNQWMLRMKNSLYADAARDLKERKKEMLNHASAIDGNPGDQLHAPGG